MTDSPNQRPLTHVETRPLSRGPHDIDGRDLVDFAGPPDVEQSSGPVLNVAQFWHYRWSLLLIFVLTATVGVTLALATQVPEYRAQTFIEVEPVTVLITGEKEGIDLYESYRKTQVDHIRGPRVIDAVIERKDVQATRWFRDVPTSPAERAVERLTEATRSGESKQPDLDALALSARDRLVQGLVATAPGRVQYVRLEFTTTTPGEARLILNAVTEEYARFKKQRETDSEFQMMEKIREEIRDRSADIAALEANAATLRKRLGTSSPDDWLHERLKRVDELDWQAKKLELKIKVAQSAQSAATQPAGDASVSAAPNGVTNASADGAESLDPIIFEADPEWARIQDELRINEESKEDLGAQLGAAHPTIRALDRKLERLRSELDAREQDLVARGGAGGVVNVPNSRAQQDLNEMIFEVRAMKQLLEEETKRFKTDRDDAERLRELQREITRKSELEEKLSARLEKLELNREVVGRISIQPAYEPSAPVEDRRVKYSAAAIGAAGLFAAVITFLRIRFGGEVTDVREVWKPASGTFVGHMPLQPRNDPRPLDECPFQAESIRMVRTALLNHMSNVGSAVIQVTSATIGAGKSTLAGLLARSLAQLDHRVLLVDADLHRQTLAKRFSIDEAPGLLELLRGSASGVDAIRSTGLPNLHVLPAGAKDMGANAELLATRAFSALLDTWRQQYDLVLLDGPPLLGTADGAILSTFADGSVFVVRERHCRRGELNQALQHLNSAGGHVLGYVFVGSQRSAGYGYGYGYGNGYSYSIAPLDAREPAARE